MDRPRQKTPTLSVETIRWLQVTAGNRAVQRLIARNNAERNKAEIQPAAELDQVSSKRRLSSIWSYCWTMIVAIFSWLAIWKRTG